MIGTLHDLVAASFAAEATDQDSHAKLRAIYSFDAAKLKEDESSTVVESACCSPAPICNPSQLDVAPLLTSSTWDAASALQARTALCHAVQVGAIEITRNERAVSLIARFISWLLSPF
jgi:hypothetical protein